MLSTILGIGMLALPGWSMAAASSTAVQASMAFVPNVLLAILFGGMLGYQRRTRHKQAGVRTHAVVAVTACVLSLVGAGMASHMSGIDPTRLGAALFSAMGFLGLVILHRGDNVSGITTVATLLLSAALGIACGYGCFGIACVSTPLILLALTVSYRIFPAQELEGHTVTVTCPTGKFKETLALLGQETTLDAVIPTAPEVVRFRVHTTLSSTQLNGLLLSLALTPNNDVSIEDSSR